MTHEDLLKKGQIRKTRNEMKLAKLAIDSARNALRLAISDAHDYEDLSLYVDDAEAAFIRYGDALRQFQKHVERLQELEG